MIDNRQSLFDFGKCVFILSVTFVLNSALTLKDSCEVVGPEMPDYHIQGEAVIIKFPFLEDAISYRKLQVDNNSSFHVDHSNQRNQSSLKLCHDRVKQSKRGVLLLPSHPSDSGTFTYILRTSTFCLTGSISITIYERPNMTVMPYTARAGRDIKIVCPHLKYFRRTENPNWYKDFQSTALSVDRGPYTVEKGIILAIKNISVKDEGFYTCRLKVIFNNTHYNVSRTWRVQVSVPVSEEIAAPDAVTSFNLNSFTSSSHSFPYIVSPVNGSFIESHSGSRLVIRCVVSIGNTSAQLPDVMWLVNGQSVENSHLGGRAFQMDKSVTGTYLRVQLVILKLQEEDKGTELKCICQNQDGKQEVVAQIKLDDSDSLWLVAAAISACFLIVVCVFVHHLCRSPQKRGDYFLARQNSSI